MSPAGWQSVCNACVQIPPLQPVKVVISGPSGVGKDAVIKALQASRSNLHFVVTATSRHAHFSHAHLPICMSCMAHANSKFSCRPSHFFWSANFPMPWKWKPSFRLALWQRRECLFRPRRPGEVEGVDYYFVSKEQFEEWIRQGELLEWALVYGDYKGIPRAQVPMTATSCLSMSLFQALEQALHSLIDSCSY